MSKEYECRKLIRAIVGEPELDSYICKVTAVNGATCDVKRILDDKEIKNVRLNATIKAEDGLVIVPKIESAVLVTTIDGYKYFVSQFSKIEKITLNVSDAIVVNEGKNGAIKIKELTDKLNELVKIFNSHIHTTSATIGTGPSVGVISATATKAQEFQQSDYEDTKILHS